jgi:hypothetical protein
MHPHTILLLAANPVAMPRLNVEDEARDIRIGLQQNGHGGAFKLEVWPAAQPLDLLHGLGTLTPTVVHFSGHGGRGAGQPADGTRRDVEQGDVHGRVDAQSLGVSLHQVGFCCFKQGQFAQALPWFERAVAAKEQGDAHGRVDAQSLGISLRRVGKCHEHLGQSAEAVSWFERADAIENTRGVP